MKNITFTALEEPEEQAKSGKAFTFVVGREIQRLREIQQYTKVKIQRGVIPSYEDIVGVKKAKFIELIRGTVAEGGLEIFADMIDQLHHAGLSNEDIILGLIKMNIGVQKSEYADMELSGGFEERSSGRDRERRGERERFSDRDRGSKREDRGSRDTRGSGRGVRENDRSSNASMVRLFINIGRDQKVRPGDIVGAIAGETGIAGNAIGSIDIYDKFSFVEVPKTDVKKVLELMDNNSIKGRKVNIEIAKQ
jgi:ATP-dependent RNA helicase DeaD